MPKTYAFFLLIPLLVQPANAGFLTGYAVGNALASSPGSTSQPPAPAVVFSDKHDVIACEDIFTSGKPRCLNGGRIQVQGGWAPYPTHEEYAAQLGYRLIHRKGVIVQGSKTYTIIEVSK